MRSRTTSSSPNSTPTCEYPPPSLSGSGGPRSSHSRSNPIARRSPTSSSQAPAAASTSSTSSASSARPPGRDRAGARTPRARATSARTASRSTPTPTGRRSGCRARPPDGAPARARRPPRDDRPGRAGSRPGTRPGACATSSVSRMRPVARPAPNSKPQLSRPGASSWRPSSAAVQRTRTRLRPCVDASPVLWGPCREGSSKRSSSTGAPCTSVGGSRRAHASGQPPILLVHGLGANTVSWITVGRDLAERRGAPVVALDLVGFGYTRALDTPATLNRNADLVVAALEKLGPAVVAGNSMGGVDHREGRGASSRPGRGHGPGRTRPSAPRGSAARSSAPGSSWRRCSSPASASGSSPPEPVSSDPEGLVDGTLQVVLERFDALDASVRDNFIAVARDRMEFPEAARAYADAAARCSGT